MSGWRRNFAGVWISQFCSIMGFTFAVPFGPYFIQELGVTDPLRLKVWVALYTASGPFSLALFAPLWGSVGDRYGRRLMLLRANLGAAVFLVLMGMATNVPTLVALRGLQGVLTGTVTAAQAMVAVQAPYERRGFAMGALNAAVFTGSMAGAACGGILADLLGYRAAFCAAAGLLVISALVIVFLTTEAPRTAAAAAVSAAARRLDQRRLVRAFWPLLVLIGVTSLARRFDSAFLPLLVQEIHGGVEGVSRWTGLLFAGASVAGGVAGLLLGHLSDRAGGLRLAAYCAAAAGAATLPHAFARSFAALFAARVALAFCVGGIEPIITGWLAKTAPEDHRAFLFGAAASARSVGWILAPLLSGVVASAWGVRAVFPAAAAMLLWLAVLLARRRA